MLNPVDTTVLGLYLLAVVAFGLWAGRRPRDLSDYLLGGRQMATWTVLLSIVATETSTVTFLSVPGLAYDSQGGSLVFLQLALGLILGRLLVVVVLLPQYFRGELFTAYEVLDRRFGGTTKQTASAMFLVSRTLADGLRLFLTALVLERLLPIDLVTAILLIGATTVAYTFLGGMRSVVLNDCVQFVVYILGAALAGWVILQSLPNGWSQFVEFGRETGRFRLFDTAFSLSHPYTLWSGLIGGVFLAMATHGADQMMVQRYLAAGTVRKAGTALAASGLVVFLQFALFLLVGAGLACYYHLNPAEATFSRNDQAFAAFIVDHLPVGVRGVTLAAVFAAAMSTLSSSLNSSAAAAVNDFYLPWRGRGVPPDDQLRAGRRLTLLFGLLQVGVAVAAIWTSRSVIDSVLAIAGFTTGIILGVFFLGVLTRSVGQPAALCGVVVGLSVVSAVAFGTSLAWTWYPVVGSGVTVAAGLAAEMVFRRSGR